MTRTTQYDHATLAKMLDSQLYVVSRSQALACGLTPGALRHRTQPDGPWRPLLPGVYLVDAREPNVPQREVAAMLYAGDGSMITGTAALWRHGIRYPVTERPQRDQRCDEVLLRSIMEIPLEALARVVPRGDDPGPRLPQFLGLASAFADVRGADEKERSGCDRRQGRARPRDVDDLASSRQPAPVALPRRSARDHLLDRLLHVRGLV